MISNYDIIWDTKFQSEALKNSVTLAMQAEIRATHAGH